MRRTAGGVILQDRRVLLGLRRTERVYYSGCWDVFGGHCESGETPEEALRRELDEELGISLEKYSLLGIYREPHPELYGEGMHYFFIVTEWSGEISNLGSEHEDIRWFAWEDLRHVQLASEAYLELFKPLIG